MPDMLLLVRRRFEDHEDVAVIDDDELHTLIAIGVIVSVGPRMIISLLRGLQTKLSMFATRISHFNS
jgi:hypothetical protein